MITKRLVALIFSLLICPAAILASLDSGESGWIILRKLEPIRPGAIVSAGKIQGELSGIFYNPAVLSTIENKELFLSGEKGFMETNFMALTMGIPTENGGISLTGALYDAGKMTLYWLEGSALKEKEVIAQRDILGSVSYARKIGGRLGIGSSLKFAQSEIAEYKKASCVAADIGLLLKASDAINLSLAVNNAGTSSAFEDKKSDLPFSVSGGISSKISAGDFFAAFGVNGNYRINDEVFSPEIGLEFGLAMVSINVGYKSNAQEGKLNAGFSISRGNYDFGYKYSIGEYLEGRHIFGIGIKWGSADAKAKSAGVDDEIAKMEAEIFKEDSGRPKKSVSDKEKALMKKYFGRAAKLYNKREYSKAVAEWEKVLKIDPNHQLSKEKIAKTKTKIAIVNKSGRIKGRENIAVMDFTALNTSASDASAVAEFTRGALVNVEKFNVLERNNMDRILAEQGFQATGCTTQECAVQMGKILNVQKAIIGSISKVGSAYFITANVVNIETSKIVSSKRVKFRDLSNVDLAIDQLVYALIEQWQ